MGKDEPAYKPTTALVGGKTVNLGNRFKPGQSGNPSGKPKDADNLRELARSYTKLAIETLAEMAKDGPPAVRVSASSILLDRGFGKPQQSIQIDVDDGREEMLRIEMIEMRKNPELNAAMLKLAEAMAGDDDE